jgi:hypothetical protein
MISLYDYQGHADKDGVGLLLNAYAQLREQPFKKRRLDFNNTEVFLYSRDFINEFFKAQAIFNK